MIEIKRGAKDDPWQKEPLTWRGLRTEDGTRSASVSCIAGHAATLTDHEIASDGTVTPSVVCPMHGDGCAEAGCDLSLFVCPTNGCGWHEHLRLLGWAE